MTKKNHAKLILLLHQLAPSRPFKATGKSHSKFVSELFQLAPKKPLLMVSGVKLVKQLIIPSLPIKKNGTEIPSIKK